jgi:rubrerythrin
MAKKPTYIGALNAVANGERGGHELFRRWADKTRDAKLKPVLEMVAIREMEHSWAFEKRLCELGYSLQPRTNPNLKKTLKIMSSSVSDEKKFQALGVGSKGTNGSDDTDQLLNLLADKNIDPQTGALIGRFICEERDTGRVLTNAYRAMKKRKK